MAVITKSIFQGRSDRLAIQIKLLTEGAASGMSIGGGQHFTRITDSDDYDVENSYIDNSHNFDITYGSGIVANIPIFVSMINDDVSHVAGKGYTNLDAYLSGQDLNVHWKYDELYYYVKGSHLLGANVFGPVRLIASEAVTGASSGTYSHNITTITSAWVATSTTNYSGEKMNIVVPAGSSITSQTTVKLYLTTEGGEAVTENVVIPTATGAGQVVVSTVGTSFIDCTNVQVLSGGTNGNAFQVWTNLERTAAL
jgi:hypothetical protein